MKTKRYFFAMVAVSAMAMCLMTSCKDKEEPVDPTPKPDLKAVAATIKFAVTFDPKTIEQCDISFDYYDENGAKKNEVVTTTEWKKEIKSASLPATLGFRWNLAAKANLDTTKYDQFVVDYHFAYSSFAVNAAGVTVSSPKEAELGQHVSVAMSKRETLVEAIHNKNPVSFVHKYDAQGKAEGGDWE